MSKKDTWWNWVCIILILGLFACWVYEGHQGNKLQKENAELRELVEIDKMLLGHKIIQKWTKAGDMRVCGDTLKIIYIKKPPL